MDVTVPSALLHAVVYSHTGLPVSSPAHVALAGGIARASTGAQGLQERKALHSAEERKECCANAETNLFHQTEESF